MNRQDHRTFIMNPSTSERKEREGAYSRVSAMLSKAEKGSTGQPISVLEKKIDSDGKLPKIPSEIVREIQTMRLKAQLTRAEVAQRMKPRPVLVKVIDEIENGTAIWNKEQVSRVKEVLQKRIKELTSS